MFPAFDLPASKDLLLVTDQLQSPADFFLHRVFATHLKQTKTPRCLLLSFSESLTRWKVLAGKANINLPQLISSGAVAVLDDRSLPSPPPLSDEGLKSLYDAIQIALSKWSGEEETSILVMLDDVSVLEWLGFPPAEVSRFLRALAAICRKASASLVIRQHITSPGEADDVLRLLLQLCAAHVEVLPLSSGRSGSVSGELALHPGPGTSNPAYKLIPRSSATQYRLTDTSCIFFERGTGNNVL